MNLVKSKFMRLFANKKTIIYLLLLALIVLAIPNVIRPLNDGLIGKETYLYLSQAEKIAQEKVLDYHDAFSYGGRTYNYLPGWSIFLAGISILTGIKVLTLTQILPYLLTFFSIVLIWLILRELKIKKELTNLTILVLIFSPAVVYLASTNNQMVLALFLTLLSFWLLIKKQIWSKVSSFLIIPLIPLFNLTLGLLYLGILLYYSHKDTLASKQFALTVSLVSLAGIIYFYLDLLVNFQIIPNEIIEQHFSNYVNSLIFDFGGFLGVSIFALILGLYGLILLDSKDLKFSLAVILFLVLIAFWWVEALIYLTLIFAFLTSRGIIALINKPWSTTFVKNTVIFITFCGLLFSLVSSISLVANDNPNYLTISGLQILNELSEPNAVIFSQSKNGFWISSIAQRTNFMDENYRNAPQLEERFKDSQILYYSRSSNSSLPIIDKYSIDYIYIDKEMRHELWDNQEDGLLFLMGASNRFILIFDNNEVTIWEVRHDI